jgi:uncharacterized membrane protein YadS
MFAMPLLGSLLNLSDQAFGVWAGTSIHAVPQVLAAAFSYSQPAGAIATLVKLVRVALLAPLIFVLGIWHSRQAGAGQAQIHYHRSGSMGRRGFKATHKAKSGLVAVRGSTRALQRNR